VGKQLRTRVVFVLRRETDQKLLNIAAVYSSTVWNTGVISSIKASKVQKEYVLQEEFQEEFKGSIFTNLNFEAYVSPAACHINLSPLQNNLE
jgi:hypothetical protein